MRIAITTVLLVLLPGSLFSQDPPPSAPTITNADELRQLLIEDAPRHLRDAAAGFTTHLHALVNDTGSVDSVRIAVSAGWGWIDQAARRAVLKARFASPADGAPVRGWIELPIEMPGLPFTQYPPAGAGVPTNRSEVVALMQSTYPETLSRHRVTAGTLAFLTVGTDGRVQKAEVPRPTCFPEADAQLLSAVSALTFPPHSAAVRRVLASASYSRDTVRLRLTGDSIPRSEPREPRPEPEGEGRTRRPQLRNRSSVTDALVKTYPQHLRNAGIGGTSVVWTHVGRSGEILEVRLSESSGICALDIAALEVANTMRFRPALNKGRAVEVWVEFPIVFSARQ